MNVTSAGPLRAIGVITLAAVLLAGCGKSEPPPPGSVSGPAPAAHFAHITLVRAGGIAGVQDKVDINRDGSWTATDKAGKQKMGRLSEDQLDQLVTAAADSKLSNEATRQQKPTACRDAYSFVLTVDTLSVAYVDCPTDGEQPDAAKKVVSVVALTGAL